MDKNQFKDENVDSGLGSFPIDYEDDQIDENSGAKEEFEVVEVPQDEGLPRGRLPSNDYVNRTFSSNLNPKDGQVLNVDSGLGSLPTDLSSLTLTNSDCVDSDFATQHEVLDRTCPENTNSSQQGCSSTSHCNGTENSKQDQMQEYDGVYLPQDDEGDSYLHLAICQGEENLAATLVDMISLDSINAQNNLGQTPLFLAVVVKMKTLVRKLIDVGAELDAVDINGNTIIHVAAESGADSSLIEIFTGTNHRNIQQFSSCLKKLLEAKNYEGYTAFHLAARNKRIETMELLMNIGADVEATDLKAGFTALHHLVEVGDVWLVQQFIDICKPYLNAMSYTGATPLHLAACDDLEPIADILILSGANPRKETMDGLSWNNLMLKRQLLSVG